MVTNKKLLPDYSKRRDRLLRGLRSQGAKNLLVTSPYNVSYLTGFTGEDSFLWITPKEVVLLSDARYEEQIQSEVKDVELLIRAPSTTIVDAAADARLPASTVDAAKGLFADLVAGDTAMVVLHGDLQHFNVLNAGGPWCVIDPHGWVGDPAFEAAALLANPRGLVEGGDARGMDGHELAVKARRRADIYAETTGYDVDRLRAWGFVGCIIAELWMIESHNLVHGAPLAVAEVLLAQGL